MAASDKKARAAVPTKWFPEWLAKIGSDAFKGKTVVITGCTSGIGRVVASTAATEGAARVLLLNRPSSRAQEARDALAAEAAKGTEVLHVDCDLQSFASVRSAAAEVRKASPEGVDVLYCNAGVMAFDEGATKDGYDVQSQTNHLSHFLLCKELMPQLKEAAAQRGEARIVNISSGARAHPSTPLQAKYFEPFKGAGSLGGNGNSMFFGGANWERYHQTKLANVVFTMGLKDRLEGTGVKAVCAEPGLTASDLQVTTAEKGGMSKFSLWLTFKLSQSAQDGALPSLWACFAEGVQSGDFYAPKSAMYGPPEAVVKGGTAVQKGKEKLGLDLEARAALWAVSEAAVGKFDV